MIWINPLQSHPIEVFLVGNKLIVGQFVFDEKHNQDTTNKAKGQSKNVNPGVNLAFDQIPVGYFQVVFEHFLELKDWKVRSLEVRKLGRWEVQYYYSSLVSCSNLLFLKSRY